jgi:hypothetical protein
LDVPVSDVVEYRKIYDAVIEEMKMIHELTNTLLRTPARIDISRGGKDMETQTSAEGVDAETNTIYISIDGKDVGIQATVEGVVAETNTFSIQGVSSQRRDNETGELAVVHWDGDNQAPSRGVNTGGFNVNNFANSGDQMSQDPGQFSLPTNMPPPMTPVVFNRNALPDTTELPYKVDASLMISDKPVSNTVAIQTQDGLVDIIPRAAQFSDLVSMVEGMNIKTKKQTTQTQDRLQELFKPRTTYIRTHATELPQEPKGTGLTLQELASSAGTQTHGRYFNPTVEMTPGNVRKFASGREGAKETKKDNETNRITQTAQTGETGFMTTQKQLSAHPVGGYAGTQRVYGPRTTSGAQIMSPLRPFFAP